MAWVLRLFSDERRPLEIDLRDVQELEIGELLEQDEDTSEKAPSSEAAIVAQAATRAYLARKKSRKLAFEQEEVRTQYLEQ